MRIRTRRTLVITVAILCAREAAAQRSYSPFEFQFGINAPTNSLLRDADQHVRRSPGGTVALVVYSPLDDIVGFRIRGEFGIHHLRTSVPGSVRSERRDEFAVGVDAIPRIGRFVARDIEARFYAGVGARLIPSYGEDVTVLDAPGASSSELPTGAGVGVTARAGWFFRRASRPAPLRFDVSYQVGELGGITQHELLFRVGIGN